MQDSQNSFKPGAPREPYFNGVDGFNNFPHEFSSADGFNNAIGDWWRRQVDKVTTVKNNSIQKVKAATIDKVTTAKNNTLQRTKNALLGGSAADLTQEQYAVEEIDAYGNPIPVARVQANVPLIIGASIACLGVLTLVVVLARKKAPSAS